MSDQLIGMLYLVNVRMQDKDTCEIIKKRLLVIGCQLSDIEAKLKWTFDLTKYNSFSITKIQKVRQKIHVLHSVVTQEKTDCTDQIRHGKESTQVAQQSPVNPNSNNYAIGMSTTMTGVSEEHAMRKLGTALVNKYSDNLLSVSGPTLNESATIHIEEIGFSSGYAKPRDVRNEALKARVYKV